MKKLMTSVGGLVLLLLVFIVFNVAAGALFRSTRFDLTENKLYTLSQGTHNILSNLQEPVTLRFYFSKKLADKAPGLVSYAQRVRELLEEYAAKSAGKITLQVADPEPFSETEDEAVRYGLKGVPITQAGEMLYFGLAGTDTTTKQEVIPFFDERREEFLEYDLTKIVYNLSRTDKKVVGLLSSLPLEGNPMQQMMNPNARTEPWAITELLRQTFDVRVLPATSEKLDADLELLVIVHPQNLSQDLLFQIDQFTLKGGKVLAFVDPFCESQEVPQDPQNQLQAMMADRSSNLGPLLGAWGLEMSNDELVGDKETALRVGGQRGAPIEYVLYMGIRKDQGLMNADDLVTSDLETLNILSAGALRKKDGATTTITPLIQSSKSSMKIPKTSIQFGPNPTELLEKFLSSGEQQMLAARIQGPAQTAFPEGKPKQQVADGEAPPPADADQALKESNGPINVIVVADVDMLADRSWVEIMELFGQRMMQPRASNGNFLVNSVDNLSGSNDLISLRSRGRSIRPFDKVIELRRDAESKYRQKEKALEDELAATEKKINDLQAGKDTESALILSPEQEAEIERFRAERVKTRGELRNVKRELNTEIESLKRMLLGVNGFLVALLVLAVGIVVGSILRSRMQQARTSGARS
jgi:ABC-type uncharacterized transport system involved in gliding motility auxiliary subunit